MTFGGDINDFAVMLPGRALGAPHLVIHAFALTGKNTAFGLGCLIRF
jgi:hypothetical protein